MCKGFCFALSSHETLRIKPFLAKKQRQSYAITQIIQVEPGNEMKYKPRTLGKNQTEIAKIAQMLGNIFVLYWIQAREILWKYFDAFVFLRKMSGTED